MPHEQIANLQELEEKVFEALTTHRRSARRWAFATWTLCCVNTLLLGALIYTDNRRMEQTQHELLTVARRANLNTERLRLLARERDLNAQLFRAIFLQMDVMAERLKARQEASERTRAYKPRKLHRGR